MHRSLIAGTVLLALGVPGASALAHPYRARSACRSAGSRTLVANGQAEVYEAVDGSGNHNFYGCSYLHGRAYEVGVARLVCGGVGSGCSSTEHVTLAGSLVAYGTSYTQASGGPGGESFSLLYVVVLDLRNGHVLRRLPTGAGARRDGNHAGIGSTTSIVLNSRGAVAWIVKQESGNASEIGQYQVHIADASGSRVVASGRDIEPFSLALAGRTLYWMQAGRPLSATIT